MNTFTYLFVHSSKDSSSANIPTFAYYVFIVAYSRTCSLRGESSCTLPAICLSAEASLQKGIPAFPVYVNLMHTYGLQNYKTCRDMQIPTLPGSHFIHFRMMHHDTRIPLLPEQMLLIKKGTVLKSTSRCLLKSA